MPLRRLVFLTLFSLWSVTPTDAPRAQISAELPWVNGRIQELQNPTAGIPENPNLLDREYDRIDQELQRIQTTTTMEYAQIKPEDIDAAKSDLSKLSSQASRAQCNDSSSAKALMDNLGTILSNLAANLEKLPSFGRFSWDFQGDAALRSLFTLPGYRTPPEKPADLVADCQITKSFLGTPDQINKVMESLDRAKTVVSQQSQFVLESDSNRPGNAVSHCFGSRFRR
jgi:hypothetical protein